MKLGLGLKQGRSPDGGREGENTAHGNISTNDGDHRRWRVVAAPLLYVFSLLPLHSPFPPFLLIFFSVSFASLLFLQLF
jgi:hypothetical protein